MSDKIYDFDTPVSRKDTFCEKWDNIEKLFGAKDLLPLWVADMDFKTPDFIIEALKKRLNHEILGYTYRPDSFYESLVNWLERRAGWKTSIKDMTFSPGIVPAINFAVTVYTSPGDKIMISTPVYHPFTFAVNDHQRTLVTSSLINNDGYYTIDFNDFENKIADGVKMFILCNPHNPVGRVWTAEELKKISDICLKYNVIVLADEIHSDLLLSSSFTHFASLSHETAQQTITFLAPSKTFNLAGLFTSVVHSENEILLKKFSTYTAKMHLDSGNIFGNIAFEEAYKHGDNWLNQLLKYIEGNAEFVVEYIKTNMPALKTLKPEGTYLMWIDCNGLNLNNNQLKEFITNKAGLALNQGYIFGKEGSGFVRINIAASRSIIKQALHKLESAVKSL